MHRAAWILLVGVTVSACTQTPTAQKEPPSWQWSWEKIQATVDKVRAGKDLTPRSWPNNSKVAVGLSFDVDNETPSLRDYRLSPSELSQGEYGSRAAMKRSALLTTGDRDRVSALYSAFMILSCAIVLGQFMLLPRTDGIATWIVEAVAALLAGALMAPFWTIGMALIYCDESEQARATAV